MNIKVCGITEMKQLQQLEGLDIDFAGLIFYKDSPRYVGDKIAKEDLKNSDFDLKKVGVFVNADYDEIMQVVEDYGQIFHRIFPMTVVSLVISIHREDTI